MIAVDLLSLFGVVVALVVVAVAAGSVALAVSARRGRDGQLVLVPGLPSRVPTAWAGSHTPEARLHRRLVDATRSLRATGVPAEQRGRLEAEAIRVEAALVTAAAIPGTGRGEAVDRVGDLIDRFESAVAELLAGTLDRPEAIDAVIDDVAAALRALDEARAEVERIDRDGTAG